MRFEQHQDGYININNKEIYHSGLQLRWLKEFNVKPDIIFDFGSEYLGDSIRYRMNFPCEIFAFEANVNLYNKTIELAKEYNINLENIAISDVDGTIMFEEAIQNGEPVGCGTIMSRTEKYKNTFPSFEYMPKIPVLSKILDTICLEKNIKEISLVHMDVEGAELLCLKSLGKIRPKAVFFEKCYAKDFYDGNGAYDYKEIIEYMLSMNYSQEIETQVDTFFVLNK